MANPYAWRFVIGITEHGSEDAGPRADSRAACIVVRVAESGFEQARHRAGGKPIDRGGTGVGEETSDFGMPCAECRIVCAGLLPDCDAVGGGQIDEMRDQKFICAQMGHGGGVAEVSANRTRGRRRGRLREAGDRSGEVRRRVSSRVCDLGTNAGGSNAGCLTAPRPRPTFSPEAKRSGYHLVAT